MNLRPGTLVYGASHEPYVLDRWISRGSFGEVFLVRRAGDNYPFALKTVSVSHLDETAFRALLNEGCLAARVNHPNVVRVHYFHDGSTFPELPPYILMDYANGGSLADVLRSRREFFDNQTLVGMMSQLAHGMKAVNDVLIHRDVKPSNILIHDGVLKIADFGLCKVVGDLTRSLTFKGINHLRYAAPEAWEGGKNTIQMDMYSIGVVFYEMATLRHPYQIEDGDSVLAWRDAHLFAVPESPDKINPELPRHVVQLILKLKLMSKRPGDRYSSWDEVLARLEQKHEGENTRLAVSTLVQNALESHRAAEARRLQDEQLQYRIEIQHKIVRSRFQEIAEAGPQPEQDGSSHMRQGGSKEGSSSRRGGWDWVATRQGAFFRGN